MPRSLSLGLLVLAGGCVAPAPPPKATPTESTVPDSGEGPADSTAPDSGTVTDSPTTTDCDRFTVFPDADGDSFGDSDHPSAGWCELPEGFVLDRTDCDDTDPEVYPDAPDVPGDGRDENCDGFDACGKGRLFDEEYFGWGDTGDYAAEAAEFCANYDMIGRFLSLGADEPTDFSLLSCVCALGGISDGNSTNIQTFRGLEQVTALPLGLSMEDAAGLTSFEGLNNVRRIDGGLEVYDATPRGRGSPLLTSFAGLESLEEVYGGGMYVEFQGTDLEGLGALRWADAITFYGPEYTHMQHLSSLAGLDSLEGTEYGFLVGSDALVDLRGFEGHTSLSGKLTVAGTAIASLAGGENLTRLGGIGVYYSPLIEDLSALTALTSIDQDGVFVGSCSAFNSLASLGTLTTFTGGVSLGGLPSLPSLDGLQIATELTLLGISETVVPDLVGLDNVTLISGDMGLHENALETLAGLESLRELDGDLVIQDNRQLEDITALHGLEWIGGDVTLSGNAFTGADADAFLDAVGEGNIGGDVYNWE